MRGKPTFIALIAIGLLMALSTTLYAANSEKASAPSIIGTWEVSDSEFQALLTFFADGNFVEVNNQNPATHAPSHGVWVRSGNTYLLTFETFNFDPQGASIGKILTYLTIKLDGADRWNATFTADVIDTSGNVTKNAFSGNVSATRLKISNPK
jgi:hypothetical protein